MSYLGIDSDTYNKLSKFFKPDRSGALPGNEIVRALQDGKSRKLFGEKSGIDPKKLYEVAKRLDFARLENVGDKTSYLFGLCGVGTIKDLASRDPKSLIKKMAEVNAKEKIVDGNPTETQVTKWIEQAKKLPQVLFAEYEKK